MSDEKKYDPDEKKDDKHPIEKAVEHEKYLKNIRRQIMKFKPQMNIGLSGINVIRQSKKGILICAGTGMQVRDITRATVGYVKDADIVLYCVANRATEMFIQQLNPNFHDLYMYYADDKNRRDTYTQMVMAMIENVRKNKFVVALFYGHPGVFVTPAHEAIKICETEGYYAKMLPGVSAADTLYADLNIDPSKPGMVQYEATDLLLRTRPLIPQIHTIIWQIGCVGNHGFTKSGYKKGPGLDILCNLLIKAYGDTYMVYLYVAATYPTLQPEINKIELKELKNSKITGITTLYIPPKGITKISKEIAQKLNLKIQYTEKENEIRKERINDEMTNKYVTPQFNQFIGGGQLGKYLINVSKGGKATESHRINPQQSMSMALLSDHEKKAIKSKNRGYIKLALDSNADTQAQECWQYLLENPDDMTQFLNYYTAKQYDDCNSYIKKLGYNCTYQDIISVIKMWQNESPTFWSSDYELIYTDSTKPQLLSISVTPTSVNGQQTTVTIIQIDDKIIKGASFSKATLSWKQADGNEADGELRFVALTGDDGKTQEPYPVPIRICSGTIGGQQVKATSKFQEYHLDSWTGDYVDAHYYYIANGETKYDTSAKAPILRISKDTLEISYDEKQYQELCSNQYDWNSLKCTLTLLKSKANKFDMYFVFSNNKEGYTITGSTEDGKKRKYYATNNIPAPTPAKPSSGAIFEGFLIGVASSITASIVGVGVSKMCAMIKVCRDEVSTSAVNEDISVTEMSTMNEASASVGGGIVDQVESLPGIPIDAPQVTSDVTSDVTADVTADVTTDVTTDVT
eukprot:518574_1